MLKVGLTGLSFLGGVETSNNLGGIDFVDADEDGRSIVILGIEDLDGPGSSFSRFCFFSFLCFLCLWAF